jgi:large subunit ribosomal protein L21
MYAVIEAGGKQFRVSSGDRIQVDRLQEEAGTVVSLDKVLLLATDQGVTVGAPVVPSARVSAEVVSHGRGAKVLVYKKKRRKQYERRQGHRQMYTTLQIKEIQTP